LSWKEYFFRDDLVADRLPWGGLTHPNIMQNKDNSFFGILAYEAYPIGRKKIVMPTFTNGWNIWIEHQHTIPEDRNFLILCWNPFVDRNENVLNGLGSESISWSKVKDAFYRTLLEIYSRISEVTTCHVLEYQEILDFLSFSLSLGQTKIEMPETPLYLDALLSQDIDFNFKENHILIDNKKMLVVSLPAMADEKQMSVIYESLAHINFRHVQRLLLFNQQHAEKEQQHYASRWCSGRKSIKKLIHKDILNTINGYHMDAFFTLLTEDMYNQVETYIENILTTLELPYIIEDFNLKDIWWGSLAGIFRANTTPPIIGFSSIDELLVHYQRKEAAHTYV
jgi:hypothetical protein